MLMWIFLVAAMLVMAFGLVVFVGPPYLPTLQKQVDSALDLLDLKPGETMLELGSGDGRVMLAAAKRGWRVVGIELNPVLVVTSIIVTWRYRKHVRVIWGSYWGKPWPRADGIFTFMLPKYMTKLDSRIEKWKPDRPIRVVSYGFEVPERKAIEQRDGVFLYEYK